MTNCIGKYALESLLGEGAMGAVYRGRDTQLGAPVAIKVIHEQLARDPQTLDRFKSEAVIQARLQHPNIVRVQDFVQADSRAAIVMEYVDGRSLDEVLAEQTGPMQYERCLAVMRQVLDAVGYAHQQGIVHRDLKPSNILAQWYGSRVHVKVSDFGIAKILGDERRRTGTHAKMGTLAYMSPEQIQSPREVDHRADIYSLGCTLYEMATAQAAYEGDTEYEVMTAIVDGRVVPPREKYPHIGEEFEGVIVKAMSVDRAARYQSCEEFRAALEAAHPELTPEKIPTQPAPSEEARRPKRAWSTPARVLTGISALLVVVIAGSLLRPRAREDAREVEISWSRFVYMSDSGNLKSVRIGDARAEGELANAITMVIDGRVILVRYFRVSLPSDPLDWREIQAKNPQAEVTFTNQPHPPITAVSDISGAGLSQSSSSRGKPLQTTPGGIGQVRIGIASARAKWEGSPSTDPRLAIDGDVATGYHSAGTHDFDRDQTMWWEADLGAVKAVSRICLLWETLAPYWKEVEIQGSADGSQYVSLVLRTRIHTDGTWTYLPVSGMYRYLRVWYVGSGGGGQGLDLMEFRVF